MRAFLAELELVSRFCPDDYPFAYNDGADCCATRGQ